MDAYVVNHFIYMLYMNVCVVYFFFFFIQSMDVVKRLCNVFFYRWMLVEYKFQQVATTKKNQQQQPQHLIINRGLFINKIYTL